MKPKKSLQKYSQGPRIEGKIAGYQKEELSIKTHVRKHAFKIQTEKKRQEEELGSMENSDWMKACRREPRSL